MRWILLSSLFLIGCESYFPATVKDCSRSYSLGYYKGFSAGEHDAIEEMRAIDATKFVYGDRVRITTGFYKGQKGMVVKAQSNKFHGERGYMLKYEVLMDEELKSGDKPVKFLYVYPKGLTLEVSK